MNTQRKPSERQRITDACHAGDGGLEPQDVPCLTAKPSSKVLKFKPNVPGVELFGREVESIRPNECPRCQGDLDKAGNCSQCGGNQPVRAVARGVHIIEGDDLDSDEDL